MNGRLSEDGTLLAPDKAWVDENGDWSLISR